MLQNLAVEITNFSVELNAQIISWIVKCFDGNPKYFRDWVFQMKLGLFSVYSRIRKPGEIFTE